MSDEKELLCWNKRDAETAVKQWGFNCGPAALCAVTGLTPQEIRPHLVGFESKGYTNPTLMLSALESLHVPFVRTYRSDSPGPLPIVRFGLIRIQWGGAWTKPGVPMRVRYRKTHWAALRNNSTEAFDINALAAGAGLVWLPQVDWSTFLIPLVMRECCPKGDGTWWVTHVLEILLSPKTPDL